MEPAATFLCINGSRVASMNIVLFHVLCPRLSSGHLSVAAAIVLPFSKFGLVNFYNLSGATNYSWISEHVFGACIATKIVPINYCFFTDSLWYGLETLHSSGTSALESYQGSNDFVKTTNFVEWMHSFKFWNIAIFVQKLSYR